MIVSKDIKIAVVGERSFFTNCLSMQKYIVTPYHLKDLIWYPEYIPMLNLHKSKMAASCHDEKWILTQNHVILYTNAFGGCKTHFQCWFSISEHQYRTNDIIKTICNVSLYLDRHNNHHNHHHHHHLYYPPLLQSHHVSGLYMVCGILLPKHSCNMVCKKYDLFSNHIHACYVPIPLSDTGIESHR